MSNFERTPTEEDWQELWDEAEHDAVYGPRVANTDESTPDGIEPDWDALLDEN